MDVPANAFLLEALSNMLTTILAIATPPHIHLAAAPFAPSPTLDPTTLTEATFVGYTPVAVATWGTPHVLANGTAVAEVTSAVNWTPTSTSTPNTIFGWWMVDHAGNLVTSGAFNTGVPMNGPTNTLQIVPAVGIGPCQYSTPLLP